MKIKKIIIPVLLCAAHALAAGAQPQQERTIVAYPLALYTPETSLMLGGGAVAVLRGGNSAARPDNITLNAIYTLKNQTVLQLLPEFYFRDERLKLRATIVYQDMPTSFFGVGNSGGISLSGLTDKEEKYTNRAFVFQPQLTHTVWGSLRAGLSYDFKNTRLSGFPAGKTLASGAVEGSAGGTLSGAGLMLDYDTRDNLFYPREGVFAQGTTRFYRKSLGSDYEYNYYSLDLRRYLPAGNDNVFALQFLGVVTGQETPFYDLPLYELRGIYNTYFTNRASWFFQAEYRFRAAKRFHGVLFAGAGNTARDLASLSLTKPQYSGGGGLRFILDEAEKINLRLDIGASPWGVEPYFGITEAF